MESTAMSMNGLSTKHRVFHEEALKLILAKGFRGTTMRDLADQMQCDVSNIYNYIPSKQALLSQHLFDMSDRFHRGIAEIETSQLEPVLQLQELIRLYVRLSFDMPLQCALLVNEWRHLQEPDQSRFLDERTAYEQKVQRMVSRGIRLGQFRKLDVTTVTHMILSSLRWLFIYVQENQAANRIKIEHGISDFLFNGVVDN